MSLTQDDLAAIKQIVEGVVEDAIEDSKQHTAAGLAEVHAKIGELDECLSQKIDDLGNRFGRIERVQRAEIERDDRQDAMIQELQAALSSA